MVRKLRELRELPDHQKRILYRRVGAGGWSAARAALLIGLSYVLLYPLLYMIITAIKSKEDMVNIVVKWIPREPTFYNLKRVWTAMEYPKTLANTVLIVFCCALACAVSAALAGYGMARFRFKGQNLMFGIVVFSIIVPPWFYLMPIYINYQSTVNLLETAYALIVPALFGAGIRSGLYIYLFRQSFRGLPKELEEAAYIDGCGYFGTFLRIIMPASVSVFVTAFLFAFVWYWNDYQVSSLLVGSGKLLSPSLANIENLTYALDAVTGDATIVDTLQMSLDKQAAALLVLAPLVLLFVFLQRYFVESVERTGLVE